MRRLTIKQYITNQSTLEIRLSDFCLGEDMTILKENLFETQPREYLIKQIIMSKSYLSFMGVNSESDTLMDSSIT